ncbi:hypothetical protein BKA93DRAFT_559892 [Sparassis latifolia]
MIPMSEGGDGIISTGQPQTATRMARQMHHTGSIPYRTHPPAAECKPHSLFSPSAACHKNPLLLQQPPCPRVNHDTEPGSIIMAFLITLVSLMRLYANLTLLQHWGTSHLHHPCLRPVHGPSITSLLILVRRVFDAEMSIPPLPGVRQPICVYLEQTSRSNGLRQMFVMLTVCSSHTRTHRPQTQ